MEKEAAVFEKANQINPFTTAKPARDENKVLGIASQH